MININEKEFHILIDTLRASVHQSRCAFEWDDRRDLYNSILERMEKVEFKATEEPPPRSGISG